MLPAIWLTTAASSPTPTQEDCARLRLSLLVRRTRTNFSDRAFCAAGSRVWNYLPMDLRQQDFLYSRFRQSLQTFSGQLDHSTALIPLKLRFRNPRTNLVTYSLTHSPCWAQAFNRRSWICEWHRANCWLTVSIIRPSGGATVSCSSPVAERGDGAAGDQWWGVVVHTGAGGRSLWASDDRSVPEPCDFRWDRLDFCDRRWPEASSYYLFVDVHGLMCPHVPENLTPSPRTEAAVRVQCARWPEASSSSTLNSAVPSLLLVDANLF